MKAKVLLLSEMLAVVFIFSIIVGVLTVWLGSSPVAQTIAGSVTTADPDGSSVAATTADDTGSDAITGEYFVLYDVHMTSSILPMVTTTPESHPVYIQYSSYIPAEYKEKLPPAIPVRDWQPTTRPEAST